MKKAIALTMGVALAAAGGTALAADRRLAPTVDPGNFVRYVTNPYYPLKPGTVLTYKGIKDGKQQIDTVTVTRRTKTIEGVKTTVVHDRATNTHGKVLEDTWDWFAQDKQGNVWYFGEDTKAYQNGQVSTEGSWQAGVHHARPGIVMEAEPKPASAYRQEFYKNHAEDQAWVVATAATVKTPHRTFSPAVKSFEWTRLEPNVIDEKDYGCGVGIVREISRTGPLETAYLVRVHRP